MSIKYDKTLISNHQNTLKINSGGFKRGRVTKEDIKMSFYAYNTATGVPVFNKTLDYEDITELYNYLNGISIVRDNNLPITNQFIELDENNRQIIDLISSGDTRLLHKILLRVNSAEKQSLLLDALTNSELNDLNAAIKQRQYANSLAALSSLLEMELNNDIIEAIHTRDDLIEYRAKQPEKIFQNWIEKNIWTLGIDYIQKYSVRKIGINTTSDMIMESTDGFIDLIELKRPNVPIFSYDSSHKCYYPSSDLSLVIGQCMHYLKKLDEYNLILEKENKFKVLRPRIKIIIGRTHEFKDDQCEALRMLNSNLTHIQVISFDHLLTCGQTIMSYYKQ